MSGQLSPAKMRALVLSAVKGAGERGATRNALLNMLDAATKGVDLDDVAALAVIGQMLEAGELAEHSGRLCSASRRPSRRTPRTPALSLPATPHERAELGIGALRRAADVLPRTEAPKARFEAARAMLDLAVAIFKDLMECILAGVDVDGLWIECKVLEDRIIEHALGDAR